MNIIEGLKGKLSVATSFDGIPAYLRFGTALFAKVSIHFHSTLFAKLHHKATTSIAQSASESGLANQLIGIGKEE